MRYGIVTGKKKKNRGYMCVCEAPERNPGRGSKSQCMGCKGGESKQSTNEKNG